MKKVFAQYGSSKSRWLSTAVAVVIILCIIGSGWEGSGARARAQSPAPAQPSATCPAGGQCFADVPPGNPFYAFVNRIYQQDLVTGYPCGGTGEPCDSEHRPYYRPVNNVTRQQMAKFIDNARHLPGIDIEVTSGTPPIIAHNNTGTAITAYSTSGQALTAQSSTGVAIYAQTGDAAAISGYSTGSDVSSTGVYGSGNTGVQGTGTTGVRGDGGTGVWGENSANGIGVYGASKSGTGVKGMSTGEDGVWGESTTGVGVYGWGYPNAWAGWFVGNVRITGNCCAMPEAYTQIDDPLDPTNKYLNQPLVQSADLSSIISGNANLDGNGEATVTLPNWFEAANGDFRYSLTAIGAPGPNLYIAQELAGNRFKIAGGQAGTKVSWQVTGVRQDPYAQQHPISLEEDKPTNEQGKYMHPAEYGQPESAGVNYNKNAQASQGKP